MKTPNPLVFLLIVTNILFTHAQILEKQLDEHFATHLSYNPEQPVANILVYLENGKNDFVYNKGFGQISLSDDTPVQKDSPFKIASITKLFTSTLILQLVENGNLKLDDKVVNLIGEIDYVHFDQLLMLDGKNYGNQITVQQLLNHTSGLADLFTDTLEEFMGLFLENPQKQWKTEDLFDLYYAFNLNNRAHYKPGKDFYYSDVNYFLLGLIIEKYTELSLADAYRTYILEPAGMAKTYFEYHENSRNNLPFPSSYMESIEINPNLNTSFDWAGGGLVSTTYDLNLFMKALFNRTLVKSDSLLEEMLSESGDRYGYGVILYNFDEVRFYGHSGFWGSHLFYNPDKDITMVISVNQTDLAYSQRDFIKKIYNLIQ